MQFDFWIGLILSDTIIYKRNKIFKCWISIICIILSVIAFVYFKNHYYYGKEWLSNLVSVIIGVLMIYAVMYISELLEIKNDENSTWGKIADNAWLCLKIDGEALASKK